MYNNNSSSEVFPVCVNIHTAQQTDKTCFYGGGHTYWWSVYQVHLISRTCRYLLFPTELRG